VSARWRQTHGDISGGSRHGPAQARA
jgi:hypothetical protein